MNDLLDLFGLPDLDEVEEENGNVDSGDIEVLEVKDLIDLFNTSFLEEINSEEIKSDIEDKINDIKNNQKMISRIALNSTTILTIKEEKLKNNNFLELFWKKSLSLAEQDLNLNLARYAACQFLQCIEDKNILTWELILALIAKLEHIQTEDNNDIYDNLKKHYYNLLQEHENNFYKLDEDYDSSSPFAKIILLIVDLLKEGEDSITVNNLMLLKLKLEGLNLNVEDQITLEEFYGYLIETPRMLHLLYQHLSSEDLENLDLFEAPIVKGVEKLFNLDNKERNIYNSLVQELEESGVKYEERYIKLRLLRKYLMNEAFVDINTEVEIFKFTVELLINLNLIWDYSVNEIIEEDIEKISDIEVLNKSEENDDGDQVEDAIDKAISKERIHSVKDNLDNKTEVAKSIKESDAEVAASQLNMKSENINNALNEAPIQKEEVNQVDDIETEASITEDKEANKLDMISERVTKDVNKVSIKEDKGELDNTDKSIRDVERSNTEEHSEVISEKESSDSITESTENNQEDELESNQVEEITEKDEDRKLEENKVDQTRDRRKGQQLILRIRENNFKEAMDLLDNGADVSVSDTKNRTALIYAAKFESVDLVVALIEAGADVNARDNRGKTALFEAISSDNVEIVKLLLDAGVDLNVKYRGHNALEMAVMWQRLEIVELLKQEIDL
ncbi:ankyrin repeat domain-containing protein [Orenia marismortui]|uniref:ankyrin repeat domain-containing protein n=1 Tax=Orenia marismortui TaxID=46469 RepID=UPI000365AAF3|nr:ankyrin repeat domain-containing protein [Orenia marismortui]